ncbi:MAG: hypothetical protein ACT4OE_09010 [Sphingosinicella sp.]
MLLHRVIRHLRKQEWTAIAIDFVIVVLGVFIGIQVANWNDARVDRARAGAYLERIHEDLQADLANYRDRMNFWAQVSNYGRAGLAFADSGQAGDLSRWELLLAYFQASQVAEFLTTDATYQELKSAGELGLIADLDLRRAFANYYTYAGSPALTERPAYRMHVRGIIPIDVQNYIWANCYASTMNHEQQLRPCIAPIDEARAAGIVDAIASNPTLMAELRYWMSTMTVASNIGRDRAMLARHLLAQVEAQLP